jgi:hypothetical protein
MEDKESGGGGGGERKVNQQPVRQQPRNRRKNVVNRARDWALKRRQQLVKEGVKGVMGKEESNVHVVVSKIKYSKSL